MAELSSQPTSVQSVYSWHNEERLYVNRRYQRKLVWTLEEKQKLIESLLKKYPIPAILLAEKESGDGVYEIIDGLQRLNAITSFIEGAFPTLDGRYFDISSFPTAQSRLAEGKFSPASQEKKLSIKEISILLDYSMAFSIMRGATNEEVDDVFDRINSYGHRLSDQERRQSGIQNSFSELVRHLACKIRGDSSPEFMLISKMPEISIDLPMMRHGYDIKADEVFWVQQGILNSTDLRDSMDEQCIADIVGSIISGTILERAKDVLDKIYARGSAESNQMLTALGVYGSETLAGEFEYCTNEIIQVCNATKTEKLRNIIYSKRNTNAFPAVFAVLFIAFHDLFVNEKKSISNYSGVKGAITNITDRIVTSRQATSPEERQKNVNTIKALISPHFVNIDPTKLIYANHSSLDIDSYIRCSGMELAHFELKQGVVSLGDKREINRDLINRIVNTICALANNGPNRTGRIVLGVADKDDDVKRIIELDSITPRQVGAWTVVGVNREAKALGISLEDYHNLIRSSIEKSELSNPLKNSVLSSIDFNAYYGLGIIIITIPEQQEPSYVGDDMYWRDGDNTKIATGAKQIAEIGRRF
ncbi:GmrSD restriction endonuclease domain-containing protein [Aeromonas schubertii]|uniref:GmrSD restriction endonuclease domain-containing protein n=1 Tax=Aeromonas schubertii TaxID=652 RepID=UPI0009E4CA2F|nr:DUF262 domain-containing protein [Aeromonas schubertii]